MTVGTRQVREWQASVPGPQFRSYGSITTELRTWHLLFKTADGGWTEAVNLGNEINSEESENRPFITADGKYLFYNSSANESRDVFWVDLGIVKKLGPVSQ